jgi:hypothetical protein
MPHPAGAELFDANWQDTRHSGMTKLRVCFRNSANAPKIHSPMTQYQVSSIIMLIQILIMPMLRHKDARYICIVLDYVPHDRIITLIFTYKIAATGNTGQLAKLPG